MMPVVDQMSGDDKYQFTYEERKEILNCVKEYFSLSKEERCKWYGDDFVLLNLIDCGLYVILDKI